MTQVNAIEAVRRFTRSFSSPAQIAKIIQHNHSIVPELLIRRFLTAKPNLLIDSTSISVFGVNAPFNILYKETLDSISKILQFQRSRRTLFSEVITQVYSIKYFNFSLNTIIDSEIKRDQLTAVVIDQYNLNRLATREFVLKLREENASNYSLLTHFDKLLL